MFGKQNLEWSADLTNLLGHPRYTNSKIHFMIKTNEKIILFGKDYVEHSVTVKDKHVAEVIFCFIFIFKPNHFFLLRE